MFSDITPEKYDLPGNCITAPRILQQNPKIYA